MYAVIEQGGKQLIIKQGDVLKIELADVTPDAKTLEIDKVLLVGEGKDAKIGTPYVEGAKVTAKFNGETPADSIVKGKKLFPTYFRRRKASKKRIGHRQKYMEMTVESITA
ncbi:MAG: 50S ribosomal protein L21 [Planctomycetes bacterium GWF2_41_51]|nr:MAG: 50S ribosomal protein L21 [Planctomycetes bacterium GWF2_41_51]HBG25721.1 50S ribosomal protein L21 [Phycisphaerales bacterium]